MKKIISIVFAALIFASFANAQIPTATHIQILKAEDARRYDKTLEDLMRSSNAEVRTRAALAAGRIGREEAIPILSTLLTNDPSDEVRAMAAFAIGEIESIKAADLLLKVLETPSTSNPVRARAVEAAGKIAGANEKNDKSKLLGTAILEALSDEYYLWTRRDDSRSRKVVLAGLTAALRAKATASEITLKQFLAVGDDRIQADALNTLARLRAKNVSVEARELLKNHADPIVRANAARVLGAAEDKDALDLLLNTATGDTDSRVRVAAIRSLGSLKNAEAAKRLIERGNSLMAVVSKSKGPVPAEMNELLEIATTLGRILPNTQNDDAMYLLNEFLFDDRLVAPEVFIAMAAIYPSSISKYVAPTELGYGNPKYPAAYAQGVATLASSKDEDVVKNARENLRNYIAGMATGVKAADQPKFMMAMPELLRATAAFKPADLDTMLRSHLANGDVFLRAAAAELLADQPMTKQNVEALKSAFWRALMDDKHDNDAQLAILDAVYRLEKKATVTMLRPLLDERDYLLRRKAFEMLSDKDLQKDFHDIAGLLAAARTEGKDVVRPYSPKFGTRLGQILNNDVDYKRALSRKNGSVKAVLTTEKGKFTIDFYPEEAPLTVDNFIKLARSGYFNGLEVHRVVPNFVMQDGDPRGDGNGGPGWSIRCEVNMLPYDRGAVGMALSGKDTGGSQWFATHSPQPHLDGGYTVFGHVNETDMKIVDNIVRGDRIVTVKIIGR